MAHPLSALGIFHTALSIAPVVAGAYAFARDGRIIPGTRAGLWYAWGMAASVVTSFGLSSTGGFNQAHALGIVALVAVLIGQYASRIAWLGKARIFVETGSLTFSFLLLMIPAINETLSRLPPSAPIGNGPDSPPVQHAVMVAAVLFFAGLAWQFARLRRYRSRIAS